MKEWREFYGTGRAPVRCGRWWDRFLHRVRWKNTQNDRRSILANGIGLQPVANPDGIGNIVAAKCGLPGAGKREPTAPFLKWIEELLPRKRMEVFPVYPEHPGCGERSHPHRQWKGCRSGPFSDFAPPIDISSRRSHPPSCSSWIF